MGSHFFAMVSRMKYIERWALMRNSLTENISEYRLSPEMEDFFDFDGFGEYFAGEYDGRFVDSGFIYYDSYGSLKDLLDSFESGSGDIKMGGI